MALELYWGSGSGPSWRALLALTIKKIPFESHLLTFSKREHKSDAMLAMNPRGRVPTLRDGAYTLYESLAILTYLDRKYPTPPLFGTTPEAAGTIVRVIMEHQCYGDPAVSAFTRPLLLGPIDDAKRRQATDAIPAMREELGKLDTQLASGPWLAGEAVSAADVFVFPTFKSLERALGKPGASGIDHGLGSLSGALPKLAAWAKRIESIPGYDTTYPPHWREG